MIWLPYSDFEKSVACLNTQHLNRQRTNCQVLAKSFIAPNRWNNNPIFKVWSPYYEVFQYYHDVCVREWVSRGWRTSAVLFEAPKPDKRKLPWFIGVEEFHSSHRANLLRLDPTYRSRMNWGEDPNLPYLWPNNNTYQFEEIETFIALYTRMGWSIGKRVKKAGRRGGKDEKRIEPLKNLYNKVSTKPIL